MVFDVNTKAVLHIEMAKKNLFVKRGELLSILNCPLNLSFLLCSYDYFKFLGA